MQITGGVIAGAQKMVIYGPEGIGKTTFAAKTPRPVFIDTEGSTKHMDVPRTQRPSSWTMLLEQVKYFRNNQGLYGTLIIDTADWAEKLCIAHICAKKDGVEGLEDFGYGKGYTYLEEEFGRLLNLLEEVVSAGMNVVFTAHATMKRVDQPDEVGSYDRWELKLQKKTSPLLKEWADLVLFANYKTNVVNVDNQGAIKGKNKAQGGKRMMYCTHHACWDAKNRHGLPDETDFSYAAVAHILPDRHEDPDVAATPPTGRQSLEQVVSHQQMEAKPPLKEDAPPAVPTENKVPLNAPPAPPLVQTTLVPGTPQPKEWGGPPEGIPSTLWDLMQEHHVSIDEVQKAVGAKGYYPSDTPVANYDPGFVNGVLVAAWPKVCAEISAIRQLGNKGFEVVDDAEDLPF